jgi:hypothetical protein
LDVFTQQCRPTLPDPPPGSRLIALFRAKYGGMTFGVGGHAKAGSFKGFLKKWSGMRIMRGVPGKTRRAGPRGACVTAKER